MSTDVHYFGIRHHGPGSARQLVMALDNLEPAAVLIEGPSDQSELIPLLASSAMIPPVALLSFPKDAPREASFWPFAEFSPEYQAIGWAVENGVPARFIDLPSFWQPPVDPDTEPPDEESIVDEEEDLPSPPEIPEPHRDPIGTLAAAAGYDDGESWWREVIEENPEPGPVFNAVADAMTALREDEEPPEGREAAREAFMRLEIAKEIKASDGPIAVVCGAFHVPALKEKYTLKANRALAKAGPKRKMMATWAPWTSPRLAYASGYGAGVQAPGWCQHLWSAPRKTVNSLWLVRVATALRKAGHIVSSASVIEAERLAVALAAIRDRATPGFEELQEATISCLCFGESLLWQTVRSDLLIGHEVGEIPDDVPLAPLLEDLKRQQSKARLKPEANDRELSVDLRSESGLFRSTLLHRLNLLGVPWGKEAGAGKSRGTFREKWTLHWQPEYAVELVENLVHGPTIERAAAGRLQETLAETQGLPTLADMVLSALTAQLPEAAKLGIERLQKRASQSSDCLSLLQTLSPLASVLRYGEARAIAIDQMRSLFDQIAVQSSISLHYATHNLDSEASTQMRQAVLEADQSLRLILDSDAEEIESWESALQRQLNDKQASKLIVGTAARLLYEAEVIDAESAAILIERQLSPGTKTADAAAFFEGFFEGGGNRLIYDDALRNAVNSWLVSLDEDTFTEQLPLLRRVFSSMDKTERAHLLNSLFGRKSIGIPKLVPVNNFEVIWQEHKDRLAELFDPKTK